MGAFTSRRMVWSGAGLFVAWSLAALFWVLASRDPERGARAPRDPVRKGAPTTQRASSVTRASPGFRVAPAPAPTAVPEVNTGSAPRQEEVPSRSFEVVGAHPHDPHEPGMVPHPLDEARSRIASENNLIQSLNDAMSFQRVDEMRELLEEYRKLDPSDEEAHQLGYQVIADCMEFPGDPSLTAARAFYDTERHSPLRRFVRRICFENKR